MKTKKPLHEKSEIFSLITRAVYTALVVIITFIVLENVSYAFNAFGYVLILVSSGVLFTLPFFMTVAKIKKGNDNTSSVWAYIIKDFLCVTIVGIFTSLIFDLINAFRFALTDYTGITTMLLSLIYLIINICFIPVYFVVYKKRSEEKR